MTSLLLGGRKDAEVQLLGKGKQIVCFCRGEGGVLALDSNSNFQVFFKQQFLSFLSLSPRIQKPVPSLNVAFFVF